MDKEKLVKTFYGQAKVLRNHLDQVIKDPKALQDFGVTDLVKLNDVLTDALAGLSALR